MSTQGKSVENDTIAMRVTKLRSYFNSGRTRTLKYRHEQLAGLAKFLRECEREIEAALYQDLKKPSIEAFSAEIATVQAELGLTQKKLCAWMKPENVSTVLVLQPGKSRVYTEPLGVVLIIAPWNYPVQLTLAPLIGAIAAGNCVVIKPSEIAPATSALFAKYLPKYLDNEAVQVIEGGVPETSALLNETFDYIFYTGNGTVGRIVMTAAAKSLTPVTLELGGKSPCIVDREVNLDVAARRIVWGKFSNAGQTCVAPDYLLVHEAIEDELLERMKQVLRQFYGDNPKISPDYGRIINSHHYSRLMKLLPGSGDIYVGGNTDETECYISPTILRHVPDHAPVMMDEIFGPILPVLTVKNGDEAIKFINARPKPLAVYLFSSDKNMQKQVIERTSSGGVCINDVMVQLIVPSLPFGGVGASGMGAYHGKASFETFSHRKSVLSKATWLDPSIMYPPYKPMLKKLLRWLM